MNTQIYLWIEPMVMNHERCTEKVYFNCIVNGNHLTSEKRALEDLIEGKQMDAIMDFADISCNWNYGVVSSISTNKKPMIEYALSPEKKQQVKDEKKIQKAITKLVNSEYPIGLAKEDIEIKDNGIIEVNLPELKISEKFDFAKIWNSLEKDVIGKIKEGDIVTLTDDFGNKIFEMQGGGFLNVALADLKIQDKSKVVEGSAFASYQGLKGGLYVREDGSMDVGDFERTFYLKIYTNNLLKASLKLKKSFTELATEKIIKSLAGGKKK